MNIIRITEQQYDDIFKWKNNNVNLIHKFKNHLFNNGLIEIKMKNGNITKIKFNNVNGDTSFDYSNTLNSIKISVNGKFINGKYKKYKNDNEQHELENFANGVFPNINGLDRIIKKSGNTDDIKRIMNDVKESYENTILGIISIYVALNVYVQNNEKTIHTKVETGGNNKSNNKKHNNKKNKNKNNKKKLLKVMYLNNINYEQKTTHVKHNFTMEAWEVKGHYRTYKNGKKVWVKPYIKGDRDKIDNKENIYVL